MLDPAVLLLSAIIFLPALGALVLAFLPSDQPELLRWVTLGVTGLVLVLCVLGLLDPLGWGAATSFEVGEASMQNVVNLPWIPSFDIDYFLGVDGISFPLVMLTALVTLLSMGASWSITKHVKAYCILFLLLETGMLGVFLSLDFFLFYVFWEVMLLPMYFLIGVWGGPRKEYAAIKFFLYTLVGSVLMLIAILMLYFSSDVRTLARETLGKSGSRAVAWSELHLSDAANQRLGWGELRPAEKPNAAIVFLRNGAAADHPLKITFIPGEATAAAYDEAAHTLAISLGKEKGAAADVVAAVNANESLRPVVTAGLAPGSDGSEAPGAADTLELPAYEHRPVHSFNLLALAAMGQHTNLFDWRIFERTWFEGGWLDHSLQWWAFLLLFIGFIIKVPSVPLHTWLPDAHVEAPTPISMILAGVLLKMGGYGIIRICYPICPDGGYDLAYFVCLLGVVSMVYGAYAALAQKDFKRMVAYSSVSHMGYVVLGLGVWSVFEDGFFNPDYWNMGVKGAMFQMIGHGVSSPGMFFMVGIVYDRVHHRNLDEFGGLFGKMPVYTAMAMGIFFAGLGLPGLCGFIGEVLVVLSVWKFSYVLAVISAAVVILTAAYILWAIQRVYLGAEYKGPHEDHLTPSTFRENLIGMTLLFFCVLLGVFPYQTVLKYMDATIDRQVEQLAEWTQDVKTPRLAAEGQVRPAALSQLER